MPSSPVLAAPTDRVAVLPRTAVTETSSPAPGRAHELPADPRHLASRLGPPLWALPRGSGRAGAGLLSLERARHRWSSAGRLGKSSADGWVDGREARGRERTRLWRSSCRGPSRPRGTPSPRRSSVLRAVDEAAKGPWLRLAPRDGPEIESFASAARFARTSTTRSMFWVLRFDPRTALE